jgi:hypothetical protein
MARAFSPPHILRLCARRRAGVIAVLHRDRRRASSSARCTAARPNTACGSPSARSAT